MNQIYYEIHKISHVKPKQAITHQKRGITSQMKQENCFQEKSKWEIFN